MGGLSPSPAPPRPCLTSALLTGHRGHNKLPGDHASHLPQLQSERPPLRGRAPAASPIPDLWLVCLSPRPPCAPPGSQGNIWEQIFRVSFVLEMINTLPFIITVGELPAEDGAAGAPSP